MFPLPLKFGSNRVSMGVTYDVIFSVSAGYQKSTQTFLMCHVVYFNNMKSNLGYISCTRGSRQHIEYIYIFYFILFFIFLSGDLGKLQRQVYFQFNSITSLIFLLHAAHTNVRITTST